MADHPTISFAEALLNEALTIVRDEKLRAWGSTEPGRGILLTLAKVQTDCYGLSSDPFAFARYIELLYSQLKDK